jgi:hypothetical protein
MVEVALAAVAANEYEYWRDDSEACGDIDGDNDENAADLAGAGPVDVVAEAATGYRM